MRIIIINYLFTFILKDNNIKLAVSLCVVFPVFLRGTNTPLFDMRAPMQKTE